VGDIVEGATGDGSGNAFGDALAVGDMVDGDGAPEASSMPRDVGKEVAFPPVFGVGAGDADGINEL
jgi:hypothetical protein